MKLSYAPIFAFYAALLTCVPASLSVAQSLVIENTGIFDVLSGEVRPGQTIVISDGVISQVAVRSSIIVPDDVTIIDGTGLTVMPGLTDVHVHMNEIDAGTFLANGVTSVRELNGSPQHLQLRDAIASGTKLGPRMLVSSPLVTGRSIQFRHVLLESPEGAAKLADELFSAGYDYLKIYDDLSKSAYEKLVSRADSLGMEITGHIPKDVGLRRALSAGQSIEHNEKIVVDVLNFDFSDFNPLRGIAELISQSGVAVTPTLAVHEFLSDRQSEEVQQRLTAAEMVYVDDDIAEWWNSTFPDGDQAPSHNSGPSDFLTAQQFLLVAMAEQRVPILAGTDTPNPLMVAGFSLHDELDALVRAGLSNEAAVRAATLTPGTHMPWRVKLGEVKVGYAADLVLVRGNPANDLSILRTPAGVIANGNWLNREKLDELLSAARRK